jgi:hypothetical protein
MLTCLQSLAYCDTTAMVSQLIRLIHNHAAREFKTCDESTAMSTKV